MFKHKGIKLVCFDGGPFRHKDILTIFQAFRHYANARSMLHSEIPQPFQQFILSSYFKLPVFT